MNRREANRLLSEVREGKPVSGEAIADALRATGDLAPHLTQFKEQTACLPITAPHCSDTSDTTPNDAQPRKARPS